MDSISAVAIASEIPPYPPGTPGFESKAGTYFHNLNAANSAMLISIQEWVDTNHINMNELSLFTFDHRLTMLRYLRANNFDFKKTTAHMLENIEWRRKHKVDEIITQHPEQLLGFPIEKLTKIFPHWQYGFDKTGRPVLYKLYGKFDATAIKNLAGGSFDNLFKYHIWEQEAASQMFFDQSLRTGHLVETITGIVDVKDMSMFQITRDFLAMVKMLAEVDQKQYPETMGRIYILNAPSVFPLVWRGIRPWLDPITAAKIFVLGDKREYEPILADFIGVDNLPANYGGNLPALTTDLHPYASIMAESGIRTRSTSAASFTASIPESPALKDGASVSTPGSAQTVFDESIVEMMAKLSAADIVE